MVSDVINLYSCCMLLATTHDDDSFIIIKFPACALFSVFVFSVREWEQLLNFLKNITYCKRVDFIFVTYKSCVYLYFHTVRLVSVSLLR